MYLDVSMKVKVFVGLKDVNFDLKGGIGVFMIDLKIKLVYGCELNDSELN